MQAGEGAQRANELGGQAIESTQHAAAGARDAAINAKDQSLGAVGSALHYVNVKVCTAALSNDDDSAVALCCGAAKLDVQLCGVYNAAVCD